jgi:bisphosphoglycerate-dependent phosphoglycerate mutase
MGSQAASRAAPRAGASGGEVDRKGQPYYTTGRLPTLIHGREAIIMSEGRSLRSSWKWCTTA